MLAGRPGYRLEHLPVHDRGLKARDGRAAERRVTWNVERRKCLVVDAAEPDRFGEIRPKPGAAIDELATQIRDPQLVHQTRLEDVRIRRRKALHAYVGRIAEWIDRWIAVRAGNVSAAVVDVIASGQQIVPAQLMVNAPYKNVA